jgi:Flp pilus assembly protein TadG
MKLLRMHLGRFARDTEGQLSIEAAMMIPLIVWVYVTTFTYFETFRADSTNVKAAYAVGDMLSRQTDPVNQTYIDGMRDVFRYMTLARETPWLRVSVVGFDGQTNAFFLQWSNASSGHVPATLAELEPNIPAMTPGDSVIVVETFMPYTPEFNIGLDPFTFRNVVVTRPRFAPQLLWTTS